MSPARQRTPPSGPPPARHVYRRRRLTALLLTTALVAAVVVLVVAMGSGGSSGRPARGSGAPRATGSASGSASSTTADRTSTTADRTSTTAAPRAASVPYRVGITSLSFDEPATAPTATGRAPSGAPIRTLPTMVRYPAEGRADTGAHAGARPAPGPFPLIVFSQGYDISAEAYAGLLDAWARAGYVVADPTYPLTDPTAPGGVDEADIVHHPADLRFVISSLLATGRHRSSVLHGVMDPARVGIVGHSDGGDVSAAVAANSCCRDRVVKAAVILSGAELAAFGGRYESAGSLPLLVVQGSADTVNVPGCSAQIYDGAPRPRYYLNIAGAEHQPPYLDPGAVRAGVARTVIAFFDAFLGHHPAQLRTLVRRGSVTAGETLTTGPLPAGTSTYCPGAP